jgi:protein O-mannosyl-transferase
MSASAVLTDLPAQTTQSVSPRASKFSLAAASLFLLTLAVYARALQCGFTNYDDPKYVTQNAQVQRGLSIENIRWAFTTTTFFNWHPLTWLSHIIDVSLFGLNPTGHHFVSVLFHAANAVLLLWLLCSATQRLGRSFVVAALFAAHPLNVESVAWIAERKSVLSTFLFFLTLAAYGVYARRPSVARYLGVAALFALALMAKPIVITLPILLLLLDYWPLNRIPVPGATASWKDFLRICGKLTAEKLPLFPLAVADAIITLKAQHAGGAVLDLVKLPFRYRVENAIYSYCAYLWKTVWPVKLAVFYPHPGATISLGLVAISALILAAISALAWRLRAVRYVPAGWLWYLFSLSPVIGILQAGHQGMADRYAYIPLIGIFVIAVWGIADLAERAATPKRYLYVASTVALLVFASFTQLQLSYWRDSIALFRHTLDVTQNNSIAEINLGQALMTSGRYDLARPYFIAATRRDPEFPNAHYNLALIYQSEQNLDGAISEFRAAAATAQGNSDIALARTSLANACRLHNQFPEAVEQYTLAIAEAPDNPGAYVGRGITYFQSGQFDLALADFTRAKALADSPEASFWLARTHEALHQNADAIAGYQTTLQRDPQAQEAQDRLKQLQQSPH